MHRRHKMQLTSSAFQAGAAIPAKYTCEGKNISPEFSWMDAPAQTKTFAFVIHDPDAPRRGGVTAWGAENNPTNTGHRRGGVPKHEQVPTQDVQGKNHTGEVGHVSP